MSRRKSIKIFGHKTSIYCEDPFYEELKRIADVRLTTITKVVEEIEQERWLCKSELGLSMYIRVWLFIRVRDKQVWSN